MPTQRERNQGNYKLGSGPEVNLGQKKTKLVRFRLREGGGGREGQERRG